MSEVRWSPVVQSDVFSQRIREQWAEQPGRRLDVLIAGCGRGSRLDLAGLDARVAGVDEDLAPLRSAAAARADLDSWSLGDLRSTPLPPRSLDVVHVSFLLERIQHAELVLDRMVAALRPGGLLLIQMRDRSSAYGFWDRTIPTWLRRRLWHRFVPARSGPGPLPAIYEPVTSREGIHSYCLMRGLMIAEDYLGSSGPALRGRHARLVRAVCGLAEKLSRGRLSATRDEITLVIRKPQNHFARLL
ncbi:class I SAM-dependent methyltransferase [Thermopolyspora sp. NPDC052614]|uniref:class I SAM-dependent methyltransferase n=1 Tax=Thermopolyspora sp. NPDC052614 TaxID=3155682 RepID=UPI003436F410